MTGAGKKSSSRQNGDLEVVEEEGGSGELLRYTLPD